jgi:hypothetical protein
MRTVTESLEDLVNEGLVTAAPEENTYELNAQALYAVGVSIEQGKVYIAALDMRLQELVSRELTVPFSHTDAYYRRLVQEMESLLNGSGLDRNRMLGVGIAVPGIIDRGRDKLVMAPTLNIWDVPLEEIYREFSRYPVYVENDANASGYLEHWLDGGQRIIFDDGLYVDLHGEAVEYTAASNGKIIAYISTASLDFVVTTGEVYRHFAQDVPLLDLSQHLPADIYDRLAPYIDTVPDPAGEDLRPYFPDAWMRSAPCPLCAGTARMSR